MSSPRFHSRTGSMITLSNSNRRAQRNQPHQEFNNGLVFSSEPLQDGQLFEVRIDRKVPSWSGSIEIGITTLDPATLEVPSSATNFREGSWVMSGTSILKDGKSIYEDCGEDLDQLLEGDRVGVMRSATGGLHFFINGVDQGEVAVARTSSPVYAVIDLYGKCAQVSIVERLESSGAGAVPVVDELRFHTRCGSMVKFSNSYRTAQRWKPVDEFNNGVVMTHRPLKDNELFEIRIDELVQKWSGSIEMGITTHNPDTLDFPATMTNMRSGTIMMSGCGILTNGKGSKREYGEFNLDELREGDRIGLMRKSDGSLHYYINGMDQGPAATDVPPVVYGVVDLYGMTVKVTINNGYYANTFVSNNISRVRSSLSRSRSHNAIPQSQGDKLLFHHHCGDHVQVINNGYTAIRPNSLDDFNHAVVLTNRPLRPGEFFQVVLEQVVAKWAGSIEIGVTTHSPNDLEFPSTMTSVRTGTWMMTGNGVMYNGTTTIDEYGSNLDNLKAGDRVGLIVTRHGNLHFYVNGVDQGLAACNVPNGVYGVIDLYGQAAKASIVSSSDCFLCKAVVLPVLVYAAPVLAFTTIKYEEITASTPVEEPISPVSFRSRSQWRNSSGAVSRRPSYLGKQEVDHINESSKSGSSRDRNIPQSSQNAGRERSPAKDSNSDKPSAFHSVCGKNVVLKRSGNMAIRVKSFDHGLLFSSKPIEREGLFEVQVHTVNMRYHGSLAIGLTDYVPTQQDILPDFAMKLSRCNTWLLFCGDVYKNGDIEHMNYALHAKFIKAGDRVAVAKDRKGHLHFLLNGKDFGIVAKRLPKNLYVVCDVFGSTECVTVTECYLPSSTQVKKKKDEGEITEVQADIFFHANCGQNIELKNGNKSACRITGYSHGIVVTNRSLKPNELFEIHLDDVNIKFKSSLRIGVTGQSPDKLCLPVQSLAMQRSVWLIVEDCVYHNGVKILSKYGPNLDNLQENQNVGIKIDEYGKLHLYVDGKDYGAAADMIPFPCYGLVDLFGQCFQVSFSDALSKRDDSDDEQKEKSDAESEKASESEEEKPKVCEFFVTCDRVRYLLFPDGFFLPDQSVCYCKNCCEGREEDEEPFHKKGGQQPACVKPQGWSLFGLKSLKIDCIVKETWHMAYHGVKLGDARSILDHRGLLPAEKLGLTRRILPSGKGEHNSESSHVRMSPIIDQAAKTAPKARIVDPRTKKEIFFNVAFQVYVRPGSYTIGPLKIDSCDNVNSSEGSDSEWYTKEEDSTILCGLLIKLAES